MKKKICDYSTKRDEHTHLPPVSRYTRYRMTGFGRGGGDRDCLAAWQAGLSGSTPMKKLGYRILSSVFVLGKMSGRGGLGVLTLLIVLCFGITASAQTLPERLSALNDLPRFTYRVLATLPHDPEAFTQGFLYHAGYFYESTGLHGRSSLRRVKPTTGEIDRIFHLPDRYFGEGLTLIDSVLVQLTWREKTAFVYDLADFTRRGRFALDFEGWGLTDDSTHLIASDGSDRLYFMCPDAFTVVKKVSITLENLPVTRINELEYIDGAIYANVWYEDVLLIIDPSTGQVTGWVDFRGLGNSFRMSADVLNGIAYDPLTHRKFVTGKLWPYVYEIALVPLPPG
ncbi:MAG TPA: glutaminyl-peptide cyclotransferase [Atribacteraceae bacterium]|nr:glutaminyl-peptide cyclotransferase [Atribacteraceae bacterium]